MFRIITFILVLHPIFLSSQTTFNKQYYFESISAIGNGIHVTDSCYYISGLVTDIIDENPVNGLFIARMDLTGDVVSIHKFQDTLYSYENWLTPFDYQTGAFTSVGYGTDSLMYTYWLRINDDYEVIQESRFRSFYHPNRNFTRPMDNLSFSNNTHYILTYTSYEEDNGGINIQTALMKLDSLGNQIWQYAYGDAWVDLPNSLAQNEYNLYLGIEHANYSLTSLNKEYYTRIIAVDTIGQTQWTWTSPSNTQQGANDMLAEADGSLIVASGRGFLDMINAQTNRILWDRGIIFKFNTAQEVEWEAEFRTQFPSLENRFSSMVRAVDNDGFVAAGTIKELYEPNPGGNLMGWLVKASPQGDSLWSRKLHYYDIQGDSIEYWHNIHDLQATPDGGYLMSGQTLDMNGLTIPRQRAWFIKVDSEGCLIPGCDLVDTQEPTPEEGPALLLYPNPADDFLNVYLGDNGGQNWTLLLYDGSGRQLASYAARSSQTTYMLPVADYPAGVYYLRVVGEAGRQLKSYRWVKG